MNDNALATLVHSQSLVPTRPGRAGTPARLRIGELREGWLRQPARVDKRRRSRRNVWFTLMLFLAVQIAVSAVYGVYPSLRDPHYHMASQDAGPVQPGQARVALLGSSRLALGWQPHGLTAVDAVHWLNLSKMGGGALTMGVYERRLMQDGYAPDLIVLEMNPLVFDRHHWDQEVQANYWPAHRLRPSERAYFERTAGSARPTLADDWLLTDGCPLAAHRFDLLAAAMPKLLAYPQRLERDVILGRAADDPKLIAEQREARIEVIRRHLSPLIPDFRLAPEPQQAMREILASCRRHGQPAVMVLMPEGPTFRSFYPESYWRDFQQMAKTLAAKYQVPLLDCREWMEEGDFEDSHHLTQQGGERFTRRFWVEHVQPRLASRGLLAAQPTAP